MIIKTPDDKVLIYMNDPIMDINSLPGLHMSVVMRYYKILKDKLLKKQIDCEVSSKIIKSYIYSLLKKIQDASNIKWYDMRYIDYKLIPYLYKKVKSKFYK